MALLAGAGILATAALVPESPVVVAAATAQPDPHRVVALTGGTWMCDAMIPREAPLTIDPVGWVPLRAGRRVVLVAFRETPLPECGALPREPVGVLRHVSEAAYETLREHDPAKWAAVPQATLAFLFPPQQPATWPLGIAGVLAVAGLAAIVYRWRS